MPQYNNTQDGLRYHARDLAVMRAILKIFPLVLGTVPLRPRPSQNALTGKIPHLPFAS